MKWNKTEMLIFLIVIVFVFFSGRLDPKLNLAITGVLLAVIFGYRWAKNRKLPR